MNTERLNHLITVLEGVSRANKAFNLHAWVLNEDAGWEPDEDATVGSLDETCGTACCALGYAALDPTFVQQGLTMTLAIDTHGDWRSRTKLPVKSLGEFNAAVKKYGTKLAYGSPAFGFNTEFDAGKAFFDITYDAAHYLFDPDFYDEERITPEMVIERVREVIAHGGDAPPIQDDEDSE